MANSCSVRCRCRLARRVAQLGEDTDDQDDDEDEHEEGDDFGEEVEVALGFDVAVAVAVPILGRVGLGLGRQFREGQPLRQRQHHVRRPVQRRQVDADGVLVIVPVAVVEEGPPRFDVRAAAALRRRRYRRRRRRRRCRPV